MLEERFSRADTVRKTFWMFLVIEKLCSSIGAKVQPEQV